MPIAARLGDKGTRHDGYYETVIIAGSPIPSPTERLRVTYGQNMEKVVGRRCRGIQ